LQSRKKNLQDERSWIELSSTTYPRNTCFIMIVDEGKAERFPLDPAAKSKAASPQALPTQRVNIGGLTYLQWWKTVIKENIHYKNFLNGGKV
jgi:hypothetical protein